MKYDEAFRLQLYIQFSSIALLYYDYALTFPDEKEYIWGSRFSLSSFLYIWCRYALVANIVFLFGFLKLIGGSCDTGYMICGVLSLIGRTSILAVWGLRTYALYNQSRAIMVWFVSLGLGCFVSDAVHVAGNRCHGRALFPLSGTVLSIFVCSFEFSATVLTVIRCYQTLHDLKGVGGRKETFSYFLLEQGIIYVTTVSGFLIAAMLLNFFYPEGFLRRLLNALSLPICGLMTARFLLRLRKRDRVEQMQTSDEAQISRLDFGGSGASRAAGSTIISEFSENYRAQEADDNREDHCGSSGEPTGQNGSYV